MNGSTKPSDALRYPNGSSRYILHPRPSIRTCVRRRITGTLKYSKRFEYLISGISRTLECGRTRPGIIRNLRLRCANESAKKYSCNRSQSSPKSERRTDVTPASSAASKRTSKLFRVARTLSIGAANWENSPHKQRDGRAKFSPDKDGVPTNLHRRLTSEE